MVMADKIIALRKRKGWSQEELASRLQVSRQSVSKWEGSASVPELEKILKMSRIFGVSTDFLLKDEMDDDICTDNCSGQIEERQGCEKEAEQTCRLITLNEANTYLDMAGRTARYIAAAVAVLIVSPAPMFLLVAAAEGENARISKDLAGGAGIVLLFLIAGGAAASLILKSLEMKSWDFLEKEMFTLQFGVEGIVRKLQEKFTGTYRKCIAAGTALCIFSIIPLMLAGALNSPDRVLDGLMALLLFTVAGAVYAIVWAGSVYGSYKKLLQNDEYRPAIKEAARKTAPISGIYWCIVTAVYLGLSFYTGQWRETWIIWLCAGVLYGAVRGIVVWAAGRREA